jgi:hypothetical protein
VGWWRDRDCRPALPTPAGGVKINPAQAESPRSNDPEPPYLTAIADPPQTEFPMLKAVRDRSLATAPPLSVAIRLVPFLVSRRSVRRASPLPTPSGIRSTGPSTR